MKILIAILLSSPTLLGQLMKQDSLDEKVFLIVQIGPEFPGGREGIAKFLAKNLRYPKEALASGAAGKVFVQFVVERDGQISNVKAIKGVNEALDKEAIRVISEMPKWKPGTQQGKPVRTQNVLPVYFEIPKKN